ncbi:ANTAR domain-containing protein [Streptomyces armeniacus]|nr:ANTAR domain-containing protein [Streptomyces armeniacus]
MSALQGPARSGTRPVEEESPVDSAVGAGVRHFGQEAELDRLRSEVGDLRRALRTHPVIDQARGIVMARAGCGPQAAWEVLVEVSQHTNTKLRVVAADVVAGAGGRPLPEPLRRALAAACRRHGRAATTTGEEAAE